MPNKQTLLDLADRVEKLDGPSRELDAEISCAIDSKYHITSHKNAKGVIHYLDDVGDEICVASKKWTASIDAAITLVLEGWSFEFRSSGIGDAGQSSIWNPMKQPVPNGDFVARNCKNPAIAITAAALRVIASELE